MSYENTSSHAILSQSEPQLGNTGPSLFEPTHSSTYYIQPPFPFSERFCSSVLGSAGVAQYEDELPQARLEHVHSSVSSTAVELTIAEKDPEAFCKKAEIIGQRMLTLLNGADANAVYTMRTQDPFEALKS